MLRDTAQGKGSTSLLALSCFTTSVYASSFYRSLTKAFKKAAASIGDSLAEGVLASDDGKITVIGSNGHFDFYEFEGCDLSKTFKITKRLI